MTVQPAGSFKGPGDSACLVARFWLPLDCALASAALFCSRCEAENGDLPVRGGSATTARCGAGCFPQEMHGGSGRSARPDACRSRHRAQITARKLSRTARSHHRRLAADSGALPGVVPRTEWPRVASRHPAVANRQRARGICCLKGRSRLTAAYSGLAFWYAGIRYVQ